MGTQKKIAQEIIDADADYLLALKGNHETVHEEVRTFLDDAAVESAQPHPLGAQPAKAAASLAVLETVEKEHGRLETRRYYQSAQLDWFADRANWEGLLSMGMVEAIRQLGGQRTVERCYYLSGLPLGWKPLRGRCAVTGAWKTNCIGC